MKHEMEPLGEPTIRETEPMTVFQAKPLESFIALKEEMMREIGVPDGVVLWHRLQNINHDLRSFQVVDKELTQRSQSHKVTDKLRNVLRKAKPVPEDGRSIMFSGREDVQRIKTEDLEKLKSAVLEELKRIEQFNVPLGNLTESELDPEVASLLTKYEKNKVYELLEPGVGIEWNEVLQLVSCISSSFDFRNRKIAEFVGYKYARSIPSDIDIEAFILNVHQILYWHKGKSAYRNVLLKNSGGFNAPVDYVLLPQMMKKFSHSLSNTFL